MASFFRKLKHIVPDKPGRRYNIACGTNTLTEWLMSFQLLFSVEVNNKLSVIHKYERQFAAVTGTDHAFSFGAGRMAFFAILEALEIKRDDEIIIPAFTCVVVPNAILYHGAKPIYVDIESDLFNIDVSKIELAITSKTKALYAQHTFGIPCDVKKIREIADRHGLYVIEDAAHALGSTVDGVPVGALSDAAFFSTDHTKTISTHAGGMAVTNNSVLAEKLRIIQQNAPFLSGFTTRRILLTFMLEYVLFSAPKLWLGRAIYNVMLKAKLLFYFSDELKTKKPTGYPFPCRLSSALAEIGIRQIDKLAENIKHRNEVSEYIESKLQWNKSHLEKTQNSVLLRYSFLVDDRNAFESLFSNHFDLGIWFTSVVQGRNLNLNLVGYKTGSCPVAEQVSRQIVNFPTHPRIPLKILKKELDKNWIWLENHIVRDDEIG